MIELKNVSFQRNDGRIERTIIDNLSISFSAGEQIALVGDSGAGKTTLLRLIAALEPLQSGEIAIGDTTLSGLSDSEGAAHRSQQGMVFQDYQLLSTLTAKDNILVSPFLAGQTVDTEWLDTLSTTLGIEALLDRFPQQLSGGEQQRVAIARALVHQPRLVLADEPTGNLDQQASIQVAQLLLSLAQRNQTTLIVVTHSQQLAAMCQRQLRLHNGTLTEDNG